MTDESSHIFYSESKRLGSGIYPMDVCMDNVIRACRVAGKSYLNAGISTEDHGKVVNHGLFTFKEKFGGKPTIREGWKWTRNCKKIKA